MPLSYPVLRLVTALALMTVGSAAMYMVVVVLPQVQAEFGSQRADASLPYALTMIGFGLGGVAMGWLADRVGIVPPLVVGTFGLSVGYFLAAQSDSLWSFALVHGLFLGLLGSSATFAPLIADTSLWFTRRRGLAVAVCASGNYLAGAVWPPIVQRMSEAWGWRTTYEILAVFVLVVMLPLALTMRARAPMPSKTAPSLADAAGAGHAAADAPQVRGDAALHARPLGLSPHTLQALLIVAGVACCVAMSMPQVHIVAYCTDLGFGPARGAEMLALMLGLGIVSRIASGFICDRIGGLATLLLGSALQMVALILFLPADALVSLYVVSALFGLFQGGIVPSYAIVVREYFPAHQAGGRVGATLTATLLGMALGGWLTGRIFDLTGSYDAAFLHGIAWNLLNLAIVGWLLLRSRRLRPRQPPEARYNWNPTERTTPSSKSPASPGLPG